MRLLVITDSLVNGGAERQLSLVMKYLPEEWERRVWSMDGGPYVDVMRAEGHRVEVRDRATRLDVRPALDLWRLIGGWRPHVVHSWGWMASAAALPICRALWVPVIDGTIRSGIVEPYRERARRMCMALSNRVVANSRAGLEAWGISGRKGRVIYNGFDPDRLPLCERQGVEARPFTVAMTGRMVGEKDFSLLIDIARELTLRRARAWRFLLVGEGPETPRLREEAADLVAGGVVSFVSPGLEVLDVVREADVGVLLSHETRSREGFSNAIMEYMACGLPVVCTNGGGNPELVVEGVTGYLIPGGDGRRLSEVLETLAGDGDRRRSLGEAGRRRILQEFTVERMIERLLSVYGELTGV